MQDGKISKIKELCLTQENCLSCEYWAGTQCGLAVRPKHWAVDRSDGYLYGVSQYCLSKPCESCRYYDESVPEPRARCRLAGDPQLWRVARSE